GTRSPGPIRNRTACPAIGMVWQRQQSIQHRAGYAAIASMLLQALPDLLFEGLVSSPQRLIHRYRYDFLPITRQCIRNVFQTDERAVIHQIFPKQQGRSAGPTLDRDSRLGFLRTGVVFDSDALYGLDHAEVMREPLSPSRAP